MRRVGLQYNDHVTVPRWYFSAEPTENGPKWSPLLQWYNDKNNSVHYICMFEASNRSKGVLWKQQKPIANDDKKAVLSQGAPRDASENFDAYRILHKLNR